MTEAGADRLDRDDWLVVGGGLVTFAGSFLPWYESRDGSVAFTAWGLGASGFFVVFLAGYAALRVLYMRGRPQKPDVPVTPQAETWLASLLAFLLMLYRVLDAPTVQGTPAVRTIGIIVAGLAVLTQFAAASFKIGRTGVRAK